MAQQCSFTMETLEFSYFVKCMMNQIKFVQFSCTNTKVVIGGVNSCQTLSMFVQTVPTKFESYSGRFDVIIPISNITSVFNIYRSTKESTTDTVFITLYSDTFSYNISFLEKLTNKGTKYDVRSHISGQHANNEIVDIQLQKLPNFVRKIKCPTQILSKILTGMCDDFVNITLICTQSTLVIQNDKYSVEILDESIISNLDTDSYIQLNINILFKILDTSVSKYIDMYFTGGNLLAMSNQHDEYLYTYYMQSS